MEKYWVWLKQNYKGNGPRCKMNGIVQYCKYNNVEPKIRKGLHFNKQVPSIRDHPLTIEECKKMYEVASLEEKILIKCWLLGIRARDASHELKWRDFDFGEPSEELKMVKVLIKTIRCLQDREKGVFCVSWRRISLPS